MILIADEKVRIDKYLIDKTGYSRSKIQKMIGNGAILVNGEDVKNSYSLSIGDEIEIVDNYEEVIDHMDAVAFGLRMEPDGAEIPESDHRGRSAQQLCHQYGAGPAGLYMARHRQRSVPPRRLLFRCAQARGGGEQRAAAEQPHQRTPPESQRTAVHPPAGRALQLLRYEQTALRRLHHHGRLCPQLLRLLFYARRRHVAVVHVFGLPGGEIPRREDRGA